MQTVKFHLAVMRRALKASVREINDSKSDGVPRLMTEVGRYLISRGLGLECIARPNPRVQAHSNRY
jgi:dihydropteroate synthase